MKLGSLFGFVMDPQFREKLDFLKHLPIFQGLKRNDFTHLMQVLEERAYLKGETLFVEGDIGRALFVVVSGSVTLTRSADAQQIRLADVKPGEIFGEMALLEEMPRTATATAAEKTKVFLLFRSKLDALLYQYPKVGVVIIHYLARTLSARLRSIMETPNAAKP